MHSQLNAEDAEFRGERRETRPTPLRALRSPSVPSVLNLLPCSGSPAPDPPKKVELSPTLN